MLDTRDSEAVDEKGGGLKPTLQSSPQNDIRLDIRCLL